MKMKNKFIFNSNSAFTTFSSHERGFTLIELLVTIALLGILAGGILIALNIGGVLGKANITKAKKFAASLERGLVISQVGKWSFEDGSGDTAKDTSGYGNNGDLAGSATTCPGGAACPTWKTATDCTLGFGGCLSFEGNDYVSFGNKEVLKPTDSVTITAWFKYGASSGYIFSNWWVSGWKGINLGVRTIGTSTTLKFTIGPGVNPSSGNNHADAGGLYNDGQWHHVVGVFDKPNNKIKIFIDGKLMQSKDTDITGLISYEDDLGEYVSIGATNVSTGATRFWNGLIDEVAIYNEPLTLSQIRSLYASGVIRRAIAYR